jgi:hypothetical protein
MRAYYASQAHYSPHQFSLPWLTGPLTEMTVVLAEDPPHLRPLHSE